MRSMRVDETNEGRWPPVYDADDLIRYIRELASRHDVSGIFFENRTLAEPCQGDVISLESGIPLLNRDGKPQVDPRSEGKWLLVGNSCDFARDVTESPWTQVVPIANLLEQGKPRPRNESAIRAYETSRAFFVPPWKQEEQDALYVADLTRPVQIHKAAFSSGKARVLATMTRAAWVLLNACLVRFLARDDGRFDPT